MVPSLVGASALAVPAGGPGADSLQPWAGLGRGGLEASPCLHLQTGWETLSFRELFPLLESDLLPQMSLFTGGKIRDGAQVTRRSR